jgi:diguanylate cyclase (GGDEF)-like protein
MRSKDSRLWAYDAVLLAAAAWMGWNLGWPATGWPPAEVALGFVLLQLLVWQYGFPAPALGLLSMERVPQVAALCLFPLPQAALLNAVPALLWPFLNRRYRQNSWVVGVQRALHNACMIWLMSLAAGAVYSGLGGPLPLRALDPVAVLAVLALAAALQLINSAMMLAFYALDGRDVRRLLTPSYLLLDLAFVPFGALLALVHANNGRDVLLLFVALVLLFVFSLHALAESRAQIQRRLETLDAAVARDAGGGSRLDAALEGLFRRIRTLLGFRVGFVAMHDPARGAFDVRIEEVDGRRLPLSRKPLDEGLAGHVFATGEPELIDDWDRLRPELRGRAVVAPGERPGCVLMVPMKFGGKVIGVVSIQHPEPHHYSRADKNALLALAEDAAPLIADAQTFDELDAYRLHLEDRVEERTRALEETLQKNAALVDELQAKGELLERQSREDSLTGLANRRSFDEQLQREIERARRYGHALGLLLVDLDHFKRVNDGAGHAAGDAVLRIVAEVMRARARGTDLVARLGGEEFAVLLPETSAEGARISAEQLRQAVAGHDFSEARVGSVTLSVGVALWRHGDSSDDLLRHADQALYRAKAEGRNCVREWRTSPIAADLP